MTVTADRIVSAPVPEGSTLGFYLDEGSLLTFCDGERAWQTLMTMPEALAMYLELHRQLSLIPATPVGNA